MYVKNLYTKSKILKYNYKKYALGMLASKFHGFAFRMN